MNAIHVSGRTPKNLKGPPTDGDHVKFMNPFLDKRQGGHKFDAQIVKLQL